MFRKLCRSCTTFLTTYPFFPQVSRLVRRNLTERAMDFHIRIEDCSITHLSFGPEYTRAVESKQVAQQEAERAKYEVEMAEQERKSKVIAAQVTFHKGHQQLIFRKKKKTFGVLSLFFFYYLFFYFPKFFFSCYPGFAKVKLP